jgi:hypothetical protein
MHLCAGYIPFWFLLGKGAISPLFIKLLFFNVLIVFHTDERTTTELNFLLRHSPLLMNSSAIFEIGRFNYSGLLLSFWFHTHYYFYLNCGRGLCWDKLLFTKIFMIRSAVVERKKNVSIRKSQSMDVLSYIPKILISELWPTLPRRDNNR